MRRVNDGPTLAALAGGVAVLCCAGLPAIGALIGAVTVTALAGVAAAVLGVCAVVAGAMLLHRARRHRVLGDPPTRGELR